MEMYRRTYAEINLEHLSHNYQLIRSIAGADRFVCPMVKANAYGHGDVQVALHLATEGVTHVGVCLIEEGLLLRHHAVGSDILVFRGFDRQGAQKMVDAQLTPVVSTWDQIDSLENVADEPLKVHLKFNTGMNRLGFNPNEAEKLRDRFKKSKKLKLKAVLTHFHSGEDADLSEGHSAQQTSQFAQVFEYFKNDGVYAHLLNSGGICSLDLIQKKTEIKSHHLLQHNWGMRPGLMLYGYAPDIKFKHLDLKPVMTFKSVVNNIRLINKDEVVSYGATWKADRTSCIAVVPVGYADGVHRLLSNRGQALFAGHVVPIVGKICMDFLMLDVTNFIHPEDIKNYDEEEVVLFGYDVHGNFLSAEVAAAAAQTITWEVLTSVGERVPRHFRGAL